jgi:hypothetical protein
MFYNIVFFLFLFIIMMKCSYCLPKDQAVGYHMLAAFEVPHVSLEGLFIL